MDDRDNKVRESTAERIQAALISDISAGLIEAGERMDEMRLADRFGVSRTPIREVLNRLTAQGILESGGGRGLRVATYSKEELSHMFEAMFEIEAVCARLASQRLTFLDRSRIERAQAYCVDIAHAGDLVGYLRANEDLHMMIYEATGNPFIAQLAADFRRRTGPFRAKKFRTKADLVASAESHVPLLASIFSADSLQADHGMRSHMTRSYVDVLAAN
ncbi:MAG: GntR family transcriptional regulator [Phyllobacteriaceae bacterium]|nr:GntR family transcriptional regulator [Phyllobacteriaceae bacterium]